MIVEDVIESWQHILYGLLASMFCCLIIIAVLRWLATPMVWLSIFGVIGLLGFGKCNKKILYFQFTLLIYPFSSSHLLYIQAIFVSEEKSTNRDDHCHEFRQIKSNMVRKEGNLVVHKHCSSHRIGHHFAGGFGVETTNSHCHCIS